MDRIKWSMYGIDYFTRPGSETELFRKLRANVVRIIPLTGRDIDNLLSVGSPLGKTRQSLLQMGKIFNEPGTDVFYGKLAPETSINNLDFGAGWVEDSPVAKFAENTEGIIKHFARHGARAKSGLAKILGYGTGLALEGYNAAKAATGLATDKIGLYTMKTYKEAKFKAPSITCRYYMPEDVNFAIKSLADLMRIVYPNTARMIENRDGKSNTVMTLVRKGVELAGKASGYAAVASPTPAMMQVGHLYDIAPVCVEGVSVRGSGGYYNHVDGGISMAIPTMLEITIALDMYMNLPASIEGGDYHWLNIKCLTPGESWGGSKE